MPDWLASLGQHQPTAFAILIFAIVIALGLGLGSLRVRGIGFGSAGVLFVGLLVGQLGASPDHAVLGFLKEFGLVLFVFTIGMQLGPGFLASLRADGLRLNLLATMVVALGALMAALACRFLPMEPAGVLGALSGAVTNTPSLGATQQALKGLPAAVIQARELPAIAYAVAYPGGIAGIISVLLCLRWWVGRDADKEAQERADAGVRDHPPMERRTLRVDNRRLDGLTVAQIPGQREAGITISRIRGNAAVQVALPATVVHVGDLLVAVGSREALDHFQPVIGETVSGEDLVDAHGPVSFARLVVTGVDVLGHRLCDLRCADRFGIAITRVLRAGVEMPPDPMLRLHFGDVIHAVGEPAHLATAAAAVGNQPKDLDHTHYAAIFLGIALGVVVGIIPIALPGLPEPVRLGLAGGPLLIAILLGRLGSLGRVVWHMPENANRSLRELGIALFLASVGLAAGPDFFATVATSTGLLWVGVGLAITVVPLIVVGWIARAVLHMKYVRICGLLAGSMTDPPALAFANGMAGGEGPAAAYAAVYPLTMILRIVVAQILVVVLCR